MSLLERLFEREVYKNHPLSRKNLRKRGLEVDYPAPFVNLLQVSLDTWECHGTQR